MKVKVIQENKIVIVTILSISENIKKQFKRRRFRKILESSEKYLTIGLYSKKSSNDFKMSTFEFYFGKDSEGRSSVIDFYDVESADIFIRRLKNSINLLNHKSEEEVKSESLRETLIEIIE